MKFWILIFAAILINCTTNPIQPIIEMDKLYDEGKFSDWKVDSANVRFPGWLYKKFSGVSNKSVFQFLCGDCKETYRHNIEGSWLITSDTIFVAPVLKDFCYNLTVLL